MDEATQQAIQIGVNITIFIVALSLSLLLLMGVRDVADVASEYNAALPTGSRVVSVGEKKRRTISGFEITSYYANYMTVINGEKSNKFIVSKIEDGSNSVTEEDWKTTSDIKSLLKDKGIDLSKEYEVIVEKYDKLSEETFVVFKAVE